MNPPDLQLQLECYLNLKQALGFRMHAAAGLLKDFVSFVEERGDCGPITAQLAMEWVRSTSSRCGAAGQASRLSIARCFLSYLRATAPETEIPERGLLAKVHRPTPYIFSPTEMQRLLDAASLLGPRGSLRSHTFKTFIGLLASTGLRSCEAIRLTVADVKLDPDPPRVLIRQTKFRKSRVVPLHPTTTEMVILAFLDHLEQHRHNSARSRNARLAALRSFFRLVALRDPGGVGVVTRVMAIPLKRVDKRLVGYLTRPEIEALLAAPDRTQWIGRRDQALLLTFYNSGARLSELTTLRQNQVNFGASAFLNLMGKGRKQRTVPLWPKTARVLQAWFRELEKLRTDWAFPNVRGNSLSSDGVNYILQQAVRRAAMTCSSLQGKRVTPHMLRHYAESRTMPSKIVVTASTNIFKAIYSA